MSKAFLQIKFFLTLVIKFLERYTQKIFMRTSKASFHSSILIFKRKYILFFVLILLTLGALWRLEPLYYQPILISEGVIGIYGRNNLPYAIASLISEPLVKLDESGNPQPNLVEGWQVNNDATIYTFKLKDNLFWHDGTPVKSENLKFNLQDVEVFYPDDKTIKFKLADSFSPFPTFLTSPIFKENSLVGLGKFKVIREEFTKRVITKLILAPASSKDKNLGAISVRFYPDEKTALTAFELGEVDALFGVLETNNMKNYPSIKIKQVSSFDKLTAVFYNVEDNNLSDKNLRRALNCAMPEIIEESQAKTSIPPFSWAYNGETKTCKNDKESAKSYLDKVQDGKNRAITLTTIPALAPLGEKIIQSWKQIGIEALLRVESGIPQNFQALLITQPIPSDPDQYALWHSTQTKTNLSNYSFARVDKDLEDARKTNDLKIRKEKYFDFQKILAEDIPASFLYFPKLNIIYREKIETRLQKVLPLQFYRYNQ